MSPRSPTQLHGHEKHYGLHHPVQAKYLHFSPKMNTKFEFSSILFQIPSTIADEDSGDSLLYLYFVNNKEHIHKNSQKAEMVMQTKEEDRIEQ